MSLFNFFSPNTPFGLYNKVQWDIRLYFLRRGAENMRSMTKIRLLLNLTLKLIGNKCQMFSAQEVI
jgi:hypothetical protein